MFLPSEERKKTEIFCGCCLDQCLVRLRKWQFSKWQVNYAMFYQRHWHAAYGQSSSFKEALVLALWCRILQVLLITWYGQRCQIPCDHINEYTEEMDRLLKYIWKFPYMVNRVVESLRSKRLSNFFGSKIGSHKVCLQEQKIRMYFIDCYCFKWISKDWQGWYIDL